MSPGLIMKLMTDELVQIVSSYPSPTLLCRIEFERHNIDRTVDRRRRVGMGRKAFPVDDGLRLLLEPTP